MRCVWIVLLGACGPTVIQIEDEPATTTDDSVPVPPTAEPSVPPTTDPSTSSAPARDYSLPGPYSVARVEGATDTSCDMEWTAFAPEGVEPTALVILSHGWARSRSQTAGWGAHFASWGLAVVTPDLCHASLLDVDHEQNAADLLVLATEAEGLPVLYAGHSAGGLASLLAAAQDPAALGVLGLDLVDSDDLGLDAAPKVLIPVAGLIGEAGPCNAENNADPAFRAAPGADTLRVLGAGHCDFESPTDWGCETFCDGGAAPDSVVGPAITGLSTAWLLWRSGAEPAAAEWWTPGESWYDDLSDAGVIAR